MTNIMLYIGTSIVLIIPIILAVSFIYLQLKNKEESLSYQLLELTYMPDFSGAFTDVHVFNIERPFSFFSEMRTYNGYLVKRFDADWSKDNINFWASKNGYSINGYSILNLNF